MISISRIGNTLKSTVAAAKRAIVQGKWFRMYAGVDAGGSRNGMMINTEAALSLVDVYAAVSRISTDVAVFPLGLYRINPDGSRTPDPSHRNHRLVHITPDGETTALQFKQAAQGHATAKGNAYIEIERNRYGEAVALHLMDPRGTEPRRRERDGKLYYELDNKKTLRAENVIHISGFSFDGIKGYDPITQARRTVALGIAGEDLGLRFFQSGSMQNGFVKTHKKLSNEQKAKIRDNFAKMQAGIGNAFGIGILDEGYDWIANTINPEDAQWLTSRRFNKEQIAALFGLPPHKIGDYSSAYKGTTEEANLDYLITTLNPWLMKWEAQLNFKLLFPDEWSEYVVDHDMSLFFRTDIKSRSEYWKSLFGMGAVTPHLVATREGFPAVADEIGGNKHFVPANMIPLDRAGANPPERGQSQSSRDELLDIFARRLGYVPYNEGQGAGKNGDAAHAGNGAGTSHG